MKWKWKSGVIPSPARDCPRLKEELGGVETLREELGRAGWLERSSSMLNTNHPKVKQNQNTVIRRLLRIIFL